MKKDLVYYSLLESMSDQRCPICALVDRRIQQMMDAFLYESVNDAKIRREIADSRGFCGYHSRMLMKKGDPLAHALIYHDILELSIQDAEKGKFPDNSAHSSCIFCKKAREMEETYLSVLAKSLDEPEFLEKYRADGLLCLEHLRALSTSRHPPETDIKKITLSKYQKLLSLLDEIKIRNDYRFASQPWSEGAKDSWKRAVAVLSDSCGLRK